MELNQLLPISIHFKKRQLEAWRTSVDKKKPEPRLFRGHLILVINQDLDHDAGQETSLPYK